MQQDIARELLRELRQNQHFRDRVPLVMNRPAKDLWTLFNGLLLQLRMPLYSTYLGKRRPRPAEIEKACECGLAMLTAFARIYEIKQIIVTTRDGWATDVSLQPRPAGLHWTAEHAVQPLTLVRPSESCDVGAIDFLFLAVHVTHVIGGFEARKIPDLTATFIFDDRGAVVTLRFRGQQRVQVTNFGMSPH